MTTANTRTYATDTGGTKRLIAVPGDTVPTGTPQAPITTMGPEDYDSTPTYELVRARIPAVSTVGNDSTPVIGRVELAGAVVGVTYTPDATITGADTNTRRFRLVNKGQDGSGAAIVAELQFNNTVNATAADEKVLPLSATAANLQVAAGDVLVVQSTHIGTGIADPGGLIRVEIDPV